MGSSPRRLSVRWIFKLEFAEAPVPLLRQEAGERVRQWPDVWAARSALEPFPTGILEKGSGKTKGWL